MKIDYFRYLSVLLLVTCSGLNMACLASPATEKSITKLIQLTELTELTELNTLLDQSSNDMQPYFDQKAEDLIKRVTSAQVLNIDEQNAALQVSALLSDLHQQMIHNPKFIQMFKDTFKKTYTEEELQAYITFLSTPMGQTINKKTNKVMSEIYNQTAQLSEQSMTSPEYQKAFQTKLMAIIQPLTTKE